MGILLSGRELVEIAIGIERNGITFYDSLAKSTEAVKASDLYKYLAGKEKEHLKLFQNMIDLVGDYQLPEMYTEEYDRYLKALIDSTVFSDEQGALQRAQKVTTEAEAIQIGLGAEKDSILFYSEMRELVHGSERDVIDQIIEEEKTHLARLSDLMRNLNS